MKIKGSITALVLKSVALVLMVTGVLLTTFNSSDFMAGIKSLFYFTIQSNILASIVCAVGLVFDIKRLRGKEVAVPKVVKYFKLVATTEVSLTLIVFWTLLSWQMPSAYLYSISNLTLHTFGPILVLLDYIFFTIDFKPNRRMIMVNWAFPMFYLVFSMILSVSNVTFSDGNHVPYFFLDYKLFGWFRISESGIGVFYWMLIVLVLIYGIGYGVNELNQLAMKKRKKLG